MNTNSENENSMKELPQHPLSPPPLPPPIQTLSPIIQLSMDRGEENSNTSIDKLSEPITPLCILNSENISPSSLQIPPKIGVSNEKSCKTTEDSKNSDNLKDNNVDVDIKPTTDDNIVKLQFCSNSINIVCRCFSPGS